MSSIYNGLKLPSPYTSPILQYFKHMGRLALPRFEDLGSSQKKMNVNNDRNVGLTGTWDLCDIDPWPPCIYIYESACVYIYIHIYIFIHI